MHPFLDHPTPIAFAHRGGSLEAEENTAEAFERAIALGYTHIETDVHATRDGVVVIHHDETLDRMAGRPERIDALDWAALSGIRTKGGAAIPRLDAVLAAFPALNVNIELKADAAVMPTAEVLSRANALSRVCLGSFSPRRTEEARRLLGPDLAWSPAHGGAFSIWLAGFGMPVGRPAFHALQVPTHYKSIPLVTKGFIRAAHKRGLHVHVWTVDDAPEMERLIDLGVDGLMTDRPTLLRDVLMRRGLWHG